MIDPSHLVIAEIALLVVGAALLGFWYKTGRLAGWLSLPDRLPFWTISGSDFMLFVLLVIVLMSVGPLAVMKLMGIQASSDMSLQDQTITAYAFHASMLIACLLFRIHPAGKPPSSGAPLKPALQTGAVACLVALPLLMFSLYASQTILEAMGVPPEPQDMIALMRSSAFSRELVFLVILPVVVSPITEELVFRAGIFRFLATRLPGYWAALLSSVIFALQHGNALAFGPLMLLGMVLCMVYQKTGRLAAPMLLHALFNLNSVIITLYGPEG